MWYALKCHPGKEEEILESCRRELDSRILCDAFLFTYDQMKRYEGSWHVEKKQMFPQYIFLEIKNKEGFLKCLESASCLKEGIIQDNLREISAEEEGFLKSLCRTKRHLAMSEGYIQNGQTHITKGPLMGWEKRIRKIDRHKRLARLEFSGKSFLTIVPAGLEIKSKS